VALEKAGRGKGEALPFSRSDVRRFNSRDEAAQVRVLDAQQILSTWERRHRSCSGRVNRVKCRYVVGTRERTHGRSEKKVECYIFCSFRTSQQNVDVNIFMCTLSSSSL
jgi:hypothetical protein